MLVKKLNCRLVNIYVLNNSKIIFCNFRLNARKWNGLKRRPIAARTVSKKQKFNFASEDRIADLKQIKLKKKSEAKIDWAVNCFIEWRAERLDKFQYDPAIYFADLTNLETIEKANLSHALCRFIPEVTKKRGEGRTLVLLCIK